MSDDFTKELPESDSDKLNSILAIVQAMETRLVSLEKTFEERLETNHKSPNSST